MELILFIVLLGLAFDYTNGFHDAANVVSTVIATRVLAPLTAIVLAGVLNTIGATHTSGVVETIAEGLVRPTEVTQIMILSALIGAIIWNLITWYFGIPSSSSYALVGGMIGAALLGGGTEIIIWEGLVWKVILPMVFSPLIGFVLAFVLIKFLFFLRIHYLRKRGDFVFRHLQIASASIVALAHGFNDAQKSMGIITLGLFSAGVIGAPLVPFWVILACAVTIGLGTAFGGFRIIRTVGFEITRIAPIQGFAAELSASCVILGASLMGMPISSTHMIVGSITGVGAARGRKAVRWKIGQKMVAAWILTLPGAALVSCVFYKLIALFVSKN
ncbi:MAG TPA: inorganic phosphate transporter [Rhabdochlamydiaceae bacterium]|nr:inorganic phosphate transporter [Rhabdochlamydiaceae bacterium]